MYAVRTWSDMQCMHIIKEVYIINCAAMDRARFLLCTGFIFLSFVGDQAQTSIQPALNHATCNVYSPNAVETLIHGKCYRNCFLLVLSKRTI